MTKTSVQPKKLKTNNFRVAICIPEQSKIRAIAKYQNSKTVKLRSKIVKRNVAEKAALQDRAEISVLQRSGISEEQIQRELNVLNENSNAIRAKLQTLSTVRQSLLWLLKKSTLCERASIS